MIFKELVIKTIYRYNNNKNNIINSSHSLFCVQKISESQIDVRQKITLKC